MWTCPILGISAHSDITREPLVEKNVWNSIQLQFDKEKEENYNRSHLDGSK